MVMRMKKSCAAALALLILACLTPLVSYGDALVESFWETAYETDYYVEVSASDGGANLRYGAGTEYDKVISNMMPNGTVLHITMVATADNGKKWGQTEYKGNYGWVALSQTKSSSGPSSNSGKSAAEIAAETGKASEDNGSSGGSTLSAAATAVDYDVKVAAPDGGVNFRYGPGTAYGKINSDMIPNGTRLHISGEGKAANGKTWGLATYDGTLGWVFLGQCEKISTAAVSTQEPQQETAAPAEDSGQAAADTATDTAEAGNKAAAAQDNAPGSLTSNSSMFLMLVVIALLLVILILTIVLVTRRRR